VETREDTDTSSDAPLERRSPGDRRAGSPLLADYLDVVWSQRLLVLAGAVTLAIAGFLVGVLSEPVYEASATLLVAEPKVDGQRSYEVSVPTYRALIENRALAGQVIDELGINGGSSRALSPIEFLDCCVDVDRLPDTYMLTVSVALTDPAQAAAAANRLAELAVELNSSIYEQDVAGQQEFLKTLRDNAYADMKDLEQRLLDFRQSAQVEVRRRDADALLEQRQALPALLADIATEEGRLTKAEEQLAEQERVLTVTRTFTDDTALMAAARQSGGSLEGLELQHEILNPVYQILEEEIATTRTRLAAFESRRAELIEEMGLDDDEVAGLADLYDRQRQLSALQLEFDLSQTIYTDLAARYEQARLDIAKQSGRLSVVDPAIEPANPVSPNTTYNAGLAFLSGLILFSLLALFLDYLARAHRRAAAAN
jgi:uncharacterized protein involved in exopolysaccharide biosynthesis